MLLTLKLGMQHRVLEYYQDYSYDDPGLTLTYFTSRSNLVPCGFVWQKGKTIVCFFCCCFVLFCFAFFFLFFLLLLLLLLFFRNYCSL